MSATTVLCANERFAPTDLARVAVVGLRTRKLRAALSALGIAIGVAAIVAVLGLSASSESGLLAEINALGTNLLTVTNGQTPLRPDRRAADGRAGDDRPDRPGERRAVHRVGDGQRLSQPAHPLDRHERAQRRRGEPRPSRRGRHLGRAGQVPERRHRDRAGLRARGRRRAASRDRSRLSGRADLARQHVVLRRGHLEPGAAHARDRLRGPRRLRRPPRSTSTSTAIPPRST